MKPNESYSVIIRRLERLGLSKPEAGAPDTDKASVTAANSATAANLSTERSLFDAQKVADIKIQFLTGNYHVDTDRLAAKLLASRVLRADVE